MIVTDMPVETLVPYARNPRNNTAAIDAVKASIAEFGFRQPIVVDEKMVLIVGHTRLEAAKALGLKTVPVHVAEGLSPAQARAYRLMDNRSHENAQWDDELLRLEFGDLKLDGFDLDLTYRLVTVDTYGRITAGSNPTTLAGCGITDAQPLDATLTALAGLSTVADRLPYATGADTFALATFTAFGRSLLDGADAAAARTTLGLGSMATQAANNVSITGGTIDSVTLDGGTF